MKKILSLILSLILCLGIFVSCDNETPSESSNESFSETENKRNGFSKEIILGENQGYYSELSKLAFETGYSKELEASGEFYTLIRTYDEFLQADARLGIEDNDPIHKTKIDLIEPSFFEEYHIVEVCRLLGHGTRISDIIGLKNAYFEDGTLHISKDEAYYSQMYASDLISVGCRYFVIPKSTLNLDGAAIEKIEVEKNLIFLEDDFYRTTSSDIKPEHGERFLITNQTEYNELGKAYGFDPSSIKMEENDIYIAIYYNNRKEGDFPIGCHFEMDGSKIILTQYVEQNVENPLYSAPYFTFINIKASRFGIELDTVSDIIVKETSSAPVLVISE